MGLYYPRFSFSSARAMFFCNMIMEPGSCCTSISSITESSSAYATSSGAGASGRATATATATGATTGACEAATDEVVEADGLVVILVTLAFFFAGGFSLAT